LFDGKYLEWNQRRIKCIIDFYGHKFMYQRKILDLGCGQSDISGALYRLGGDITSVDARQEHLTIANKKFPGIKTVKADLDQGWPFGGQKFDIILDLALVCHLRDFEQHLINVCSSTTYLVLETAVCDSDDPNKCVIESENKGIYDNSINGVACRPTAAAIERVLTACGMTFKRMDSGRLNSPPFIYDWQVQNSGDTSIGKRRLWFANKTANPSQAMHVSPPAFTLTSSGPSALQNSYQPAPYRNPLLGDLARPPQPTPTPSSAYQPTAQYNAPPTTGNDDVRESTRRFAIITPENFSPPSVFSDISGTILPVTASARRWFKKISLFCPNLLAQRKMASLQGFAKSDDPPNIVICSLNYMVAGPRVWLEEWSNNALREEHISVLKRCNTIMTPSLINMQEILRAWPEANVVRTARPWPLLDVPVQGGNYFIYLEQDPALTRILFDSWLPYWGDLVVVGSKLKLPNFAKFISEHDDYIALLPYLLGSKALIHLSNNTYYMSGVEQLARGVNLPIITNNACQPDGSSVIQIPQDNVLTGETIAKGMTKFIEGPGKGQIQLSLSYNNQLHEALRLMMGV
jgi:hypothetical protein